ncbi:MAG: hypothetical protein Tsb0020_39390 [Haliangiales bacterium]
MQLVRLRPRPARRRPRALICAGPRRPRTNAITDALTPARRSPPRPLRGAAPAALLALAGVGVGIAPAGAQSDVRYRDEPTAGVALPTLGLAGEHDAFSVSQNPAGLYFLHSWEAGLALDLEDSARSTSSGQGLGLFLARPLGGELVPRVGVGAGFEFLRPSGDALTPAPGSPTRHTLAAALGWGRGLSLGVAWHRLYDDRGRIADGLSSVDLGISSRWGPRWALGAVVRDLNGPTVADAALAGDAAAIERRYEVELLSRPLATDRLEIALGGRVGELSGDVDGWARASVRVLRGVYARAAVDSRALRGIDLNDLNDPSDPGGAAVSDRELRVSAGLEISFGAASTGLYATASQGPRGTGVVGGAALLRVSPRGPPSVLPSPARIERVDLSSDLDGRELARALLALHRLARDPAVKAVFIQIDRPTAGWGTAQELLGALSALRAAKKRVFAYLVSGGTRDYFIASGADRIYLDPAGTLSLVGLSANTVYFKGIFDKLGVNAQFEKIEEYKSAPESFTQSAPSEPAARMSEELYDGIYAQLVAAIADGRGLSPAAAAALIDDGPYTAGDLEDGPASALVDAIATPEQVAEEVARELGAPVAVARAPRRRPDAWSWPAVAVVHIDGDIIDGRSSSVPLIGRQSAGSETITQALARAREDDRVVAVVVRINSPGGSALASEFMAREVFKLRAVKPVICSLGDVAASGGYFAAAGCHQILAEPTTITGSIGIFTGKFEVSALLGQLGITWHSYERGQNASLESIVEPYSDADRALIRDKIEYFYGRFLDVVAEGRGMTRDQVDALGRGRVYTGARALEIGLVDQIGSFADAVALAKRQAGLDRDQPAELLWLPKAERNLIERALGAVTRSDAGRLGGGSGALVGPAGGSTDAAALADALAPAPLGELGGAAPTGQRWPPGLRQLLALIPASLWLQPRAVQARLPFAISWQ